MSKIKVWNAKRCIAVFMAVLMMILSLSYTNCNHTDASNTRRLYYVYNAKTAVKTGQYYLDPVTSENNARTIIGTDDRVIDWTKSGVVKLLTVYDDELTPIEYMATGFVVDDHTIATAAHCVYNQIINDILLFDNSGNVTLHATPVEYHYPAEYQTYNDLTLPEDYTKYEKYDYALITVKEDLSDYACFNLGVPLESFPNKKPAITITGFPIYIDNPKNIVNTITNHMMYSGNGFVNKIDNDIMYCKVDTCDGNSGGPIYITESLKGNTYYTVLAIDSQGEHTISGIDHTYGNHGPCITTDLIHFYNKNSNIKWK